MNASPSTKKVLFVAQQPETVDFSDPALPPGFDAARIHSGIAAGMAQMAERGWHAALCMIRPDDSAAVELGRQLAGAHYDAVVIGGGIRIPPSSLLLFEQLVNVVHRAAPAAALAFNTTPLDTADAAARWFK